MYLMPYTPLRHLALNASLTNNYFSIRKLNETVSTEGDILIIINNGNIHKNYSNGKYQPQHQCT